MTDQTPLDVDSILDDMATQIGQHVKQNTILMAQVRKLSKDLEEALKARDEALVKSRRAPEAVSDESDE